MTIVDIAVEDSQYGDSRAARCLSQVSRALRACTMPKLYGFLIINPPPLSLRVSRAATSGSIVGHNSRVYEHRYLALLSWLLLDPTAELRKYIKHMAISEFAILSGCYLAPTSGRDSSANWTIGQLIVRHRDDAIELYRAGLRAQEVHLLGVEHYDSLSDERPLDFVAFSGHLDWFHDDGRGHYRCWSGCPNWTELTADHDNVPPENNDVSQEHAPVCIIGSCHRRLDSETGMLDYLTNVEPSRRGQFFMIEVQGGLLTTNPNNLAEDIARILLHESMQTVVLVHARGDHAATNQVTAILAASKRLLSRDTYGRLKVSHVAWDRDLLLRNPVHAYVSLVRRGIDPWDDGHVPDALLSQN